MNKETIESIKGQIEVSLKVLKKSGKSKKDFGLSEEMANRFNQLLHLSKENLKEIDSKLWPAEIQIIKPAMGIAKAKISEFELEIFLNQLLRLLEENIEPPMMMLDDK